MSAQQNPFEELFGGDQNDFGGMQVMTLGPNGVQPLRGGLVELFAQIFGDGQPDSDRPAIDLEAAWTQFQEHDYSSGTDGMKIAVVGLAIHAGNDVSSVDDELFFVANDTLNEVRQLDEPCCANPWCSRMALFQLVARYNNEQALQHAA